MFQRNTAYLPFFLSSNIRTYCCHLEYLLYICFVVVYICQTSNSHGKKFRLLLSPRINIITAVISKYVYIQEIKPLFFSPLIPVFFFLLNIISHNLLPSENISSLYSTTSWRTDLQHQKNVYIFLYIFFHQQVKNPPTRSLFIFFILSDRASTEYYSWRCRKKNDFSRSPARGRATRIRTAALSNFFKNHLTVSTYKWNSAPWLILLLIHRITFFLMKKSATRKYCVLRWFLH